MLFNVSQVEPDLSDIGAFNKKIFLNSFSEREVLGFSKINPRFFKTDSHAFIDTLLCAFSAHRPLLISPDDIWLLICQGFSQHINSNPEKFRHLLVKHTGKKSLQVIRNDFSLSGYNPWHEVVEDFSLQIKENSIGDVYQTIVSNFSTTDSIAKSAFEISLMSTMKNYFTFDMDTLCGIPSIRLSGTKDDYLKILNNLDFIESFDFKWWTKPLRRIIGKFIDVFDNKIDTSFWQGIFKYIPNNESGETPRVNGWSLIFFPYMSSNFDGTCCPNPLLFKNKKIHFDNFDDFDLIYEAFASSLSVVDVKWVYHNESIIKWFNYDKTVNLEFQSGFLGVAQDKETKEIYSQIGWVITKT